MDSEALVVGAGPTGLMMATELIRRGIDTRIVDRAARRNPHAKAIILQPRALEVMARLGLEDRIRDAALPVVAANYYARGRRVARINFRGLKGSRFGTPSPSRRTRPRDCCSTRCVRRAAGSSTDTR